MTLPTFKSLEAAYQLHFYLAFKTHYLRPLFQREDERALVKNVLDDVCNRQRFHLLEANVSDDHLRLLVSLKPEQTISSTVKTLKGSLSREFGLTFPKELAS